MLNSSLNKGMLNTSLPSLLLKETLVSQRDSQELGRSVYISCPNTLKNFNSNLDHLSKRSSEMSESTSTVSDSARVLYL